MPDTKISALTNAAALDGTEAFPVVQGGNNRKATPAQVATYLGAVKTTVSASDPTVTSDANNGQAPGNEWVNTTTGAKYTCRSATAGAAVWVRVDVADHPGYVTGRWYMPVLNAQVASGAAWGTAGVIRFLPFVLKERTTISDLGARIITASSGGNIQLGIYRANAASRLPTGSPVAMTGNISTTSTGSVAASCVGGNQTLEPGLCWMAVNADNTVVALQTLAGTATWASAMIGSATQANISAGNTNTALSLSLAQAFGTWPDVSAASFTESTGNVHGIVQFKEA